MGEINMEQNQEPTNMKVRLELQYSKPVSAEQLSYLSRQTDLFIDAIQTFTTSGKALGISWTKTLSWTENSVSAMCTATAQDAM